MNYNVSIAGRTYVVTIDQDGVRLNGTPVDAQLAKVSGDAVSGRCVVQVNDQARAVEYRYVTRPETPPVWNVSADGVATDALVLDDRERHIREMVAATAQSRGPEPVKAPMPGMVVKLDVSVGDVVEVGQGVVVVEAMKMENELRSKSAGVVAAIHIRSGEAVEKDQILIEFSSPQDGLDDG